MAANEIFLELFNAPVSTRPSIREVRGLLTYDLSQDGQLSSDADGTTGEIMKFASKLTTYHIGAGGDASHGRVREAIEEKPIGAGTYGTIFITKAGDEVIKKLWVKDNDETDPDVGRLKIAYKTRGFFLEAFVQSILASDARFGRYVSKPVALYRDASLTRGVFAPGAGAAAAVPDVYLYIKMESIKYPFKGWLEAEKARLRRPLEVPDVMPLFVKLAEMLTHFDTTYQFRHGDLHTGNIMVTAGGDLTLIDFGMSCMKVTVASEERLYRVVDYGDTTRVERCDSFDLLIFFTAFLENQVPKFFSAAAAAFFKGMFSYGSENLYDQLYAKRAPMKGGKAGEKEPVFWQTYPWELDKRVKAGGRLLRTVVNTSLPHFATPKGMFDYLSAIVAAAAAAARPATRAAAAATGRGAGAAAKLGGGYQTSQQFFNPSVLPPAASPFAPVVSAAPTADMIRPITYATFKTGGSRRRSSHSRSTRRRVRGGFSPSVMGGFIPNAQAAIVPAAMYLAYHGLVRKKGSRKIASAVKKLFKGGRRSTRRA